MKLVIACTLIVASAFANPIPQGSGGEDQFNRTMTLEKYNKACAMVREMGVAKGYMPSWAVDPICNLEDADKNALVAFSNDFHAGKVAKPTSNEDFIRMVGERSPKAGEAMKTVLKEFDERLSRLPQQWIDLQKKWEQISYASADADRLTWFTNMAQHAKEYVKDIESIDENGWSEIRKEFPELEKIQKSEAFVLLRKFITDMKDEELTDKEKIKNLFKMTIGRMQNKIDQANA